MTSGEDGIFASMLAGAGCDRASWDAEWRERLERAEADRLSAMCGSIWDQMVGEERFAEEVRRLQGLMLARRQAKAARACGMAAIGLGLREVARLQVCAPTFSVVSDVWCSHLSDAGAWWQVPDVVPLMRHVQKHGRLLGAALVGVRMKSCALFDARFSAVCGKFESLCVLQVSEWTPDCKAILSVARIHTLDVAKGMPDNVSIPTLQTLLAPAAFACGLTGSVALRRLLVRVSDHRDASADLGSLANAPNLESLHIVETDLSFDGRRGLTLRRLFGGLQRARLCLREFVYFRPRTDKGAFEGTLVAFRQALDLRRLRFACLTLNEHPGGRQAQRVQEAAALAAAAPQLTLWVPDWPGNPPELGLGAQHWAARARFGQRQLGPWAAQLWRGICADVEGVVYQQGGLQRFLDRAKGPAIMLSRCTGASSAPCANDAGLGRVDQSVGADPAAHSEDRVSHSGASLTPPRPSYFS
mmetsp:Transcript_28380/g.85568  ORF Transcript_28380/g.85568 Transcript_28380/m.85568 type:complete len:472 (-) Transcript_28380:317-1732(-)